MTCKKIYEIQITVAENKVLLEHSHTAICLHIVYGCFCDRVVVTQTVSFTEYKTFAIWPFTKMVANKHIVYGI